MGSNKKPNPKSVMSPRMASVLMKSAKRKLEVVVVVLVKLGIMKHLDPTGVYSTLIVQVITNLQLTWLNPYLIMDKHMMFMILNLIILCLNIGTWELY